MDSEMIDRFMRVFKSMRDEIDESRILFAKVPDDMPEAEVIRLVWCTNAGQIVRGKDGSLVGVRLYEVRGRNEKQPSEYVFLRGPELKILLKQEVTEKNVRGLLKDQIFLCICAGLDNKHENQRKHVKVYPCSEEDLKEIDALLERYFKESRTNGFFSEIEGRKRELQRQINELEDAKLILQQTE